MMLNEEIKAKQEMRDWHKGELTTLRAKRKQWGIAFSSIDSLGIMSVVFRTWRHMNQLTGVTMHYEKLLEFQMAKYENALESQEKEMADLVAQNQRQLDHLRMQ